MYGTQASVPMSCGSFLVAAEIAEFQKAPQGRSGPAVGRCCWGGWIKRCQFRVHHFFFLEHREVRGELRHRLHGLGWVQFQKSPQPLDQNHLQLPDARQSEFGFGRVPSVFGKGSGAKEIAGEPLARPYEFCIGACGHRIEAMADGIASRPLLAADRAWALAVKGVTPVRCNLPLGGHGETLQVITFSRIDQGRGSCAQRLGG
jgi:hypothetical protein